MQHKLGSSPAPKLATQFFSSHLITSEIALPYTPTVHDSTEPLLRTVVIALFQETGFASINIFPVSSPVGSPSWERHQYQQPNVKSDPQEILRFVQDPNHS